jgi:O-antigen/teichoic acid export membrane protein
VTPQSLDAGHRGVRALLGKGSVYTLATAGQAATGLLVLPFLTRLLDPTAYGVVASATVVLQLVGLAAALGLPGVMMLEWFESDEGPNRARRLAVTTVLGALLVAGLLDLTGPWWSQLFAGLGYDTPLRLAVWATVPLAAVGAAQGLLRSAGRAGTYVGVTLAATLVAQASGLLVMVVTERTPSAYFAGLVAALVVAGVIGLVAAGVRSLRPADLALTRRSLATALPTVPHSVALFALFAVDRIMVERYDGLAGAGRYQLAYLIGAAGLSLVAAVNNAWSPIILGTPEGERWEALASTSLTLTRLAVAIALATALAAPMLLSFAAPSSYDTEALARVCTIVAASLFPYLWYLSNVHVVLFHRRTTLLAVTTPTAVVANVALNVLLIPPYGLTGAAIASFLGYGVLSVLVLLGASRMQHVPWRVREMLVAWTVGVVGLAVVWTMPAAGAAWIVLRAVTCVGAGIAVLVIARRAVVEERALESTASASRAGSA